MVFFYVKDVVCVVYFCILVTLASGIQVRDPLCTCWDASSPYTQEQLYKIYLNHHHHGLLGASLIAQPVKNLPAMQETHIQLLGWEDPLEKGMATQPGILARDFYEQRGLVGYTPWGHKESDMCNRPQELTYMEI